VNRREIRAAKRSGQPLSDLRLEHPKSPTRSLTASIGAATTGMPANGSVTALVEAADCAVYRANQLGRSRTDCLIGQET
jgi:PleD family two-component response regulator